VTRFSHRNMIFFRQNAWFLLEANLDTILAGVTRLCG